MAVVTLSTLDGLAPHADEAARERARRWQLTITGAYVTCHGGPFVIHDKLFARRDLTAAAYEPKRRDRELKHLTRHANTLSYA